VGSIIHILAFNKNHTVSLHMQAT